MRTSLTILRVFLGGVFIMYSFTQLMDLQFPRRHIHSPIDQVEPMTLVWYFFGFSQPYKLFIALIQLVIGTLLTMSKTARIALLLYFPFAMNIAIMSWCFGLPLVVKVLATFVTIGSLGLIIRELAAYRKLLV